MYINEILWLLSWPVMIGLSYAGILLALKKWKSSINSINEEVTQYPKE